jgi:hypothetical protein
MTLQLWTPSMKARLGIPATTPKAYQEGWPLIVAYDYGMKRNIARMPRPRGARSRWFLRP